MLLEMFQNAMLLDPWCPTAAQVCLHEISRDLTFTTIGWCQSGDNTGVRGHSQHTMSPHCEGNRNGCGLKNWIQDLNILEPSMGDLRQRATADGDIVEAISTCAKSE